MRLNRRLILSLWLIILVGCQPQEIPVSDQALPAALANTVTIPQQLPTTPPPPDMEQTPTTIPVAISNPYLWMFNSFDRTLLAIDPQSNQVNAKINLTDKPDKIAQANDAVWVLTADENNHQFIVRLNPFSLQIEASIPVQQGKITCMTAMDGAVWVGVETPGLPSQTNALPPGGVVRIDSGTNEISHYLPAQGQVKQIAFDGESVWVLEWLPGNTFFEKIDPNTLQVQTIPPVIPSMEYVHDFVQFAINPDGIWALSESRSARSLYRVDPTDGKITSLIPLGNDPNDLPMTLAADSNSVWVILQSGKMLQVDSKTTVISREMKANNEINQILVQDSDVWAFNRSQAILYHVDLVENQIGAMISTGRKMPPTAVPGPTQIPGQVCEGSYPSHIHAGFGAMVNPEPPIPNRVRVEPNKNSKLLGEINPGEKIRVTEGPVCTEGWVWWKVDARNGSLIGWTAEGDGQDYWLIPLDK